MWKAYQTIPINEESDSNGQSINWSNDSVLAIPTLFTKKVQSQISESNNPNNKDVKQNQKFYRSEKRIVAIRLFSIEKPGVIQNNLKTVLEYFGPVDSEEAQANIQKLKARLVDVNTVKKVSLKDQLRIDIYPMPKAEEMTFKSGFVELINVTDNGINLSDLLELNYQKYRSVNCKSDSILGGF